MVRVVAIVTLFFVSLCAKEVFLRKHIFLYLNEKNPFYYNAIGKEAISQAKERFYEGAFDTQFSVKYDDKKYPVSKGEFKQIGLSKSVENGMEFSFAYRNAQGVQEYNNIKTSVDGEILSSIKIPILSAIKNISKNRVDLESAKLNTKKLHQNSRYNLLTLYLQISKAYYELLFQKDILQTEDELLKKAKMNFDFISKEVAVGRLPKIALLEIQSQIIDRQQRQLNAYNAFIQAKNIFLQYLGVSSSQFDNLYDLPHLPRKIVDTISFEDAKEIAIANRPELKRINYEIEKVKLQQEYNHLSKYPKLDLKLYGVYDLKYKEGYKVSIDFNFPFERRRYKGQDEALRKQILLLHSLKHKFLREVVTKIKNLLQKISVKKDAIKLSFEELKLVEKLEKVESRKYKEGMSHLMSINQREIKTIQTKQKLLRYHYELKLLEISLDYELGRFKQLYTD
ncbi:MAG TPA: TolC family protein [Campylobacterales bacterium]|nr:TolC family protein [Campylobacterales bacterium]